MTDQTPKKKKRSHDRTQPARFVRSEAALAEAGGKSTRMRFSPAAVANIETIKAREGIATNIGAVEAALQRTVDAYAGEPADSPS